MDELTVIEELRSGIMLETTTEIFYNIVQKSYLETMEEESDEKRQRQIFYRKARSAAKCQLW